MNHLQFIQAEAYVSPSERRWETWVADVRRLSGRAIDPGTADESDAHDCWLAGDTPAQCIAELWPAPCTHCGCDPKDVDRCCTTGAGRNDRPCDGETP